MKQAKNPRVDMNVLQGYPYIATFGSIATYIAIAKFTRIGIDFQISEAISYIRNPGLFPYFL